MMKKLISVLCIALLIAVSGCSSNANKEENNNQAINPVSDVTVEDISNDLGLKGIDMDVINTQKIDGDPIIYSFDYDQKDYVYNIRLAKGEEEVDISGIYLSKKRGGAIYDASNDSAPSISVESDKKNTVARGYWNGYNFSVSLEGKQQPDFVYEVTSNFMQMLISKDNIK